MKKAAALILFIFLLCFWRQNPLWAQANCGLTLSASGPTTVCEGTPVELKASYPRATVFEWYKSGKLIPGAIKDTYTALEPAVYVVKALDGTCSAAPRSNEVTVRHHPFFTAEFSVPKDTVCSGLPAAFTNLSKGEGLRFEWDFGDPEAEYPNVNTSTATSPTHIYKTIGAAVKAYTVTLRVISREGCVSVIKKNILIRQEPEAAIIDPVSNFDNCAKVNSGGNSSFALSVTDVSITKETNTSYRIAWGDNTPDYVATGTFKNVPHTYEKEGAYTLTVTVIGKNGCMAEKEYLVKNIGKPAALELSDPRGTDAVCGPISVTYNIKPLQNSPTTTYTIDFDDGSPLVSLPHPPPPSITHVFDSASCAKPDKRFIIRTTATNACQSAMFTLTGPQVFRSPKPRFTIENGSNNRCVNQTIRFKNFTLPGSNTDCSNAVTYSWDFGDGTVVGPMADASDARETMAHLYKKAGTYTVSLTASNSCGSATMEQEICILSNEPVAFDIIQPRASSCSSDTISLKPEQPLSTECTEGRKLKWRIEPNVGVMFLNGTNDSTETPDVTFTSPGDYAITLTATTACGTETFTKPFSIQSKPVVRFGQGEVEYCEPQTVKLGTSGSRHGFTVSTPAQVPLTYQWTLKNGATFAAGSTAQSQEPEVVFPEKGEYTVEVTVTSDCGPSLPATQIVSIFDATQTIAVLGDTVLCEGESTVLQVQKAVGTCKWYTQPTGGTAFATGLSYTTPALAAGAVTYYVEEESADGCVSQSRKAVTLQVFPGRVENKLASASSAQCAGAVPALMKGNDPSTPEFPCLFRWEMSQDGLTFAPAYGASTGRDYQAPALTKDTWFRRVLLRGGCPDVVSDTIKVRVYQLEVPQAVSKAMCQGEPVVLQVASPKAEEIYKWYSKATGGVEVGEGATLAIPAVIKDTAYYVQAFQRGTSCGSPERTRVQVTLLPPLQNNTVTGAQHICPGTSLPPFIGSTPQGGDGTYTYQWEYSYDNILYELAPGTATGKDYVPPILAQATWFRRIAFSGECGRIISQPIKVTVSPPIANNSIGTGQVVCEGEAPGMIWGTQPTGANGEFTFLWEVSTSGPTGGFEPAPGNNAAKDYLPAPSDKTRWFRRVVSATLCPLESSAVVEVRVEALPRLGSLQQLNQRVCAGEPARLPVPNPDWQYRWYSQPQGGTVLHTGKEFTTPPLQQKTVFYVEAMTANGCLSPDRAAIEVEIVRPQVMASHDMTILQGRGVHLLAQANLTGSGSFRWVPAAGLQSPDQAQTLATPDKTTTYQVTYTTPEGCSATDEVTIEVLPALFIPNVLTQNQDGLNDDWDIKNIEYYPNCRVEIFNHWGSLIFSSTGYKNKWNGTYAGSPLPVSAYYYIIYINDVEKPITGSVTIVK